MMLQTVYHWCPSACLPVCQKKKDRSETYIMKTVLFCETFSSIHVHNEINEDLAILISKKGKSHGYTVHVYIECIRRANSSSPLLNDIQHFYVSTILCMFIHLQVIGIV